MGRRIGDTSEDLIIAGVVVGGIFFVIKPLVDLFREDPQDRATIQHQQTLQPTANCFSYQYQPFVNNFNANPSYNPDGSVMTMQQFFQVVQANNDAGQPLLIDGDINIAAIGESLRSALSPWVLATDANEVLSVFSPFYNQTQVAALDAYLYFNYGEDLLTKLTGSIFKVGLSPADLSLLITKMNALPSQ